MHYLTSISNHTVILFGSPAPPSHKDDLNIWWVWTKQMGEEDTHFHNIRYPGDTSLTSIARFTRLMTVQKMVGL